ncbi:type 4 pilus major pilin [Alcaligenes sp. WGS1538]|uniref:type 4 pilus major pilin n=1 Tax=Alcaligenes sp. WGS1538 TaxID=3366811 RepID=UPI00372CFBFA
MSSYPRSMPVQRQRGFSLLEVSVVTAIILLVAILAVPAIGSYLIESRVPKVGEELSRFIVQTQVHAPYEGGAPYAGMSTAALARQIQPGSALTVSANRQQVLHGLGSGGQVSLETRESGSAFAMTLDKVNHAACPALLSMMQRLAAGMSIQAGGALKEVKSATLAYNALAAQANCAHGDSNTFVLVVR